MLGSEISVGGVGPVERIIALDEERERIDDLVGGRVPGDI